MRLAFGLIALTTSRNKIGNFCNVASGLLIANNGTEMVPFCGFVSTIGTTDVFRADPQDAQRLKFFRFCGVNGRDDRVDEGVSNTRRTSSDAHRRGELAVSDSFRLHI